MVSAAGVEVRGLQAHYGTTAALRGLDLDVAPGTIVAIIGPAQAGKSTLLKCLSRMSDEIVGLVVHGEIRIGGDDVHAVRDVASLRRRVGLVAPLPVGLPMSVLDNVTFAPRMAGVRNRAELRERAEECLRAAALWDEVKDRLGDLATRLSGGQQQRLAIARALSHEPEVLCLDEFSIAIDPVTTERIEALLRSMRGHRTIILVTNLVHQARRLADVTAMMWDGRVLELQPTAALFEAPRHEETRGYIEGRFG
ncbi:MAG: ATP-binding cassette domain-containing protein [Deltaproteobacteria bacterium]|nr:ATP-binding cassette domain-containing protein [Nannocystaceae bacterium]